MNRLSLIAIAIVLLTLSGASTGAQISTADFIDADTISVDIGDELVWTGTDVSTTTDYVTFGGSSHRHAVDLDVLVRDGRAILRDGKIILEDGDLSILFRFQSGENVWIAELPMHREADPSNNPDDYE